MKVESIFHFTVNLGPVDLCFEVVFAIQAIISIIYLVLHQKIIG